MHRNQFAMYCGPKGDLRETKIFARVHIGWKKLCRKHLSKEDSTPPFGELFSYRSRWSSRAGNIGHADR